MHENASMRDAVSKTSMHNAVSFSHQLQLCVVGQDREVVGAKRGSVLKDATTLDKKNWIWCTMFIQQCTVSR